MLYLDAAIEIRGLTIHRDYNDKSRFYYSPKSPRMSVEAGQPMFQLLLYRDVAESEEASTAGGFLTMTTDLGVPSSTLEQAARELSSRFGVQASLAPLPVKGGTVRVTALDSAAAAGDAGSEPRFVENLIASGTPSLYGDQRAVFTAELSRKGAALMKAAIDGDGATPVVVVYELQYAGLLPAYDVSIKISFRQAYEHLRSRMQMNTLWFRTDVDRELENLVKSGSIEIEEVVYETETTEQTSARMARLNTLAKELAQWSFFSPALSPGTVLAADRGTLQAYDATPTATSITAGLTSGAAAALTGVGATQDAGQPRRPGTAVATGAVEEGGAETTQPSGQEEEASGGSGSAETPQPPPSGGPPTAVEAWNRAGRPQGAYLLRNLTQNEQQDIEYNLRQVTAVERTIAPQGQIRLLPGSTDLPGRILEVDLDSEFFKTIDGAVTTAADLEALGVSSIQVKIRYGVKPDGTRWKDQVEKVLTAAGQSHAYRFAIDSEGSREMQYQVILNYRPDASIGDESTREETDWITTTTRTLDINPLTHGSLIPVEIAAGMVDWQTVQQIQAKVRYRDDHSNIDVADTRILTSASPTASIRIRPKNAAMRQVGLKAQFFTSDGDNQVLETEQAGDEPFVLNQPSADRSLVDVRMIDALSRYSRITVQLAKGAAASPQTERTVNLGEGQTEVQWSFRRQGGPAVYSYRVTSFLTNGSVQEGSWKATDNPLVLVGDRSPGVLEVRTMLLGTLEEGGFRLLKLRLSYPEAPEWADADVEHVFRAGAEEEFVWRVPMERLDAKSYVWEAQWFGTDGSRRTSGPHTVTDEILLLDPLAP